MNLPCKFIESVGFLHESFAPHPHPHAPGASLLDYAIVVVATLIAAYTLVRAAQVTFRPEETDPNHIKRTILEE